MTSDELRTRFEVLTAALAQLPATPAITWRGYDGSTPSAPSSRHCARSG